MKNFYYLSLFLLSLFVIGNATLGCVSADTLDDKTVDVKVNDLFELNLPTYLKTEGKFYYWSPTFDNEHMYAYNDMENGNWCFKALKKGKTIMLMQLYEINVDNNTSNLKKTVSYTINMK